MAEAHPTPSPDPEAHVSYNAAQRRAIEHRGGPLAVLAGPGTGKTRVIVGRIAHMVQSCGIKPEEIVAVTFTVKAAAQLRARLADSLGPSAAGRIHASTFHGLGLRLIRRFSDTLGLTGGVAFGDDAEPVIIDTAQRRRLLRDLVIDHDLLRDQRAGAPLALLSDIEAHFGAFWDHAITPAALASFVAAWAAAHDRGDLFRPADDLSLEADRLRLRQFADIAALFGHFQRACRARGWLSFGDLITLPIELLRLAPVATIVRSEWRHVVVDEFQDVNAAQIDLLRAIVPPGAGPASGGPDLCVVGDDDQSIYAFRGADDLAFDRFSRLYPTRSIIELSTNYRSLPPIVAASNRVISGASYRFAPDKQCVPAAASTPDQGRPPVLIVNAAKENEDGEAIAALVLAARAQARHAGQPLPAWRSFAVVARSHADLDRIGAALAIEGIPCLRGPGRHPHDDPGVADVLAWVELLVNPRATWAARRILLRPPFGLSVDRVTTWERAYARHLLAGSADTPADAESAPDQLPPSALGPGFVEWLRDHTPGPDAPPGTAAHETVSRFVALHDDLARDASSLSAEQALWRIAVCSGAAHADLLDPAQRPARVEAIVALLRLGHQCQPRLDQPRDLPAFYAYFNDLTQRDRAEALDPDSRVDAAPEDPAQDSLEEPGSPEPPAGTPGADGVHLLTAHASKGLEFDTVFVPRVRSPHGYPKTTRLHDPEIVPPGLIDRGLDQRPIDQRRLDEERRLFYVACSRAQRRLFLLTNIPKQESDTTAFIRELVPHDASDPLATIVPVADVFKDAAAAGVRLSARSALPHPAPAGAASNLPKLRACLAQLRLEARAAAAAAMDTTDRPGTAAADLAAASARFHEASGVLAIVAALEAGADVPAWADVPDAPQSWRDAREQIIAARAPAKGRRARDPGADPHASGGTGDLAIAPPTPPLTLSYTQISLYQRCPRCFCLRYVFHAPDHQSSTLALGNLVHQSLQRFYTRWQSRDAEGSGRLPALPDLLADTRANFRAAVARGEPLDRSDLDRALAQVRLAFERLHNPEGQVLEIEQTHRVPYPRAGHEHVIVAKLDRLDQAPDGSRVIVDYKTGQPHKKLLEPETTDLQLGIYALALPGASIAMPGTLPPQPPFDHAEYWLLSTGQKGRIGLHTLDFPHIHAAIDSAIDGILAGRFARSRNCWGDCELLGP